MTLHIARTTAPSVPGIIGTHSVALPPEKLQIGSKDTTLAKVRIPEDEVPESLATDLEVAFRQVLVDHGIDIDD